MKNKKDKKPDMTPENICKKQKKLLSYRQLAALSAKKANSKILIV